MASGYTHELNYGEQSFEDFAFGCAKAFGAYIHLRDEPSSALSKIDDDSARYVSEIGRCQTAYDEFTALSEEEQRELYNKYVDDMTKYYAEQTERIQGISDRYGRMLARVIAWRVPEELKELREFMKNQLEESIRFDCSRNIREIEDFDSWLDGQVNSMLRSIQFASERLEKEKKRVAEQHAWHEALFKSVRQG